MLNTLCGTTLSLCDSLVPPQRLRNYLLEMLFVSMFTSGFAEAVEIRIQQSDSEPQLSITMFYRV